ncbi:hypothetical protein OCU04_009292 [Sclerotinia nivalis]|uniref:Major facilitator superfamily (MFS) profile domain-containing protein n=1 Tax=Sclerotinia nivalis TaxID=352851 RepID=A0A9X0AEW7_9HELO|nr:hypothetical protein OCU04_009292 [Sclerotinia nivalis]
MTRCLTQKRLSQNYGYEELYISSFFPKYEDKHRHIGIAQHILSLPHSFTSVDMFEQQRPDSPAGNLELKKPARGIVRPVTSEEELSDQPPAQLLSTAREIALVLTLAGAGFLNIIFVQSAVIMLPSISEALGIPPNRQQWITSSYNIAFACVLLLWGRLADIYGRRIFFIYGSIFVTIITVTIPFSPGEIVFDILRALQGLGSAATVPSAVGILSSTFPPGKKRTYAFVTYTATSALGSVMGNIMGGIIGAYLSWKWVFWIIAILAAFTTVAGIIVIPRPPVKTIDPDSKLDVDWIGGALISTSLITLLFALTEGGGIGWSTPWIPVLIVVALLLMVVFYFWQRHLERTDRSPLVKVSMFRNAQFTSAFAIIGCFFASYNSYLIFATYFYQDFLGLGVIETTVRFLPAGVAGLLVSFVTAKALTIFPGFYVLVFSTICGIISPLLFALPISPNTTYWAYGFPAMCLCISADMLSPTINLFVVGRSLGLAIATAVQGAVGSTGGSEIHRDPSMLKGLRAGEWVNVGLAAATLLLVLVFFRATRHSGAS